MKQIIVTQNGKYFPTGCSVEDFQEDIEAQLKQLDVFCYLAQINQVVQSCCEDYLTLKVYNNNDFWKVNKNLLAYVNAVYAYKQYLKFTWGVQSNIGKIQESYFQKDSAYRFICTLRDKVIHQGNLIRHYDRKHGDTFFCIEDMIEFQKELLDTSDGKRFKAGKFIESLENLLPKAKLIAGKHYLYTKNIIRDSSNEVGSMNDEICTYLWNSSTQYHYMWILLYIYKEKGAFKHTLFINNSESYDLNEIFENNVLAALLSMGTNSRTVHQIVQFIKNEGYECFFTQQGASIDEILYAIKNEEKSDIEG